MMKIEKNCDNLAKLESQVVEEERGVKKIRTNLHSRGCNCQT